MANPGAPGTGHGLEFRLIQAEGVGFDPTSRGHLLAVFKSACSSALTRPFTLVRPVLSAHSP